MKVENTVKTNFEQYAYGKLKSLIKRVIEIKNHEYNFIDNKNINNDHLLKIKKKEIFNQEIRKIKDLDVSICHRNDESTFNNTCEDYSFLANHSILSKNKINCDRNNTIQNINTCDTLNHKNSSNSNSNLKNYMLNTKKINLNNSNTNHGSTIDALYSGMTLNKRSLKDFLGNSHVFMTSNLHNIESLTTNNNDNSSFNNYNQRPRKHKTEKIIFNIAKKQEISEYVHNEKR